MCASLKCKSLPVIRHFNSTNFMYFSRVFQVKVCLCCTKISPVLLFTPQGTVRQPTHDDSACFISLYCGPRYIRYISFVWSVTGWENHFSRSGKNKKDIITYLTNISEICILNVFISFYKLLPYYVMESLGEVPGVPGIFVASIFSASLR